MALPDLAGLVEARLQAQCPLLRQVGGSADLPAAEEALRARPAAFVVPLAERPSDPLLLGDPVQRLSASVGVVLAVANLRDPRGDAAREDLVAVRQQVRAALLGWLPAGCLDRLACAGSRLVRLDPRGVLWWQDDFLASYLEGP